MQELAKDGEDWHVSILMPTHVAGAGKRQDAIRLKNLTRDINEELERLGVDRTKAKELLAYNHDMDRRLKQQNNGGGGMAVFAMEGFARSFRTSFELPERAVVNRAFHITPLLPAIHDVKSFHLLALSRNGFHLYKCDPNALEEVEIPGLREIAGDARTSAAGEKQLQFHTGAPPVLGMKRPALFHGRGIPSDRQKERLVQAFQRCDRLICDHLNPQETALVIAGVEHYLPLYREVSNHHNLLDQVVAGSPEPLTLTELYSEARQIAKRHFDEPRRKAAAQCEEWLGTQQASNIFEEILPAAHHGRVQFLFVDPRQTRWGEYHPVNEDLIVRETRKPGDEDLLNLAARYVLLTGGEVYAQTDESVPGGGIIAAVFRY